MVRLAHVVIPGLPLHVSQRGEIAYCLRNPRPKSPAQDQVLSINGLLFSISQFVFAGLDPAIHRGPGLARRWTLGSSPRVTMEVRVETGKPSNLDDSLLVGL
jgi:hypothetical protein